VLTAEGEAVMARKFDGLWEIIQTNGFTVPVNVGPVDSATQKFTLQALENGSVTADGSGNVDGDFVHFIITWNTNSQGAYNGTFNDQGVLNGSTFDVKTPGAVAGWHSSKSF
jgi:hypothetical protein